MKKTLSFMLILLVWACDERIKIDRTAIFYLTVNSDYDGAMGSWLMIHDPNGELIDAMEFASGDHIAVEAETVPDFFTVTFCGEGSKVDCHSYGGIEAGESWSLSGSSHTIDKGDFLGIVTASIENAHVGSFHNIQISSAYTADLRPNIVEPDHYRVTLYPEDAFAHSNKFFVFATDANDNPVYKFFQTNGGNFAFSLNEFASFDRVVNLSFPSTAKYFIYTKGYEENQTPHTLDGYFVNVYLDGLSTGIKKSSVKLGFTSQFPVYWTVANIEYENQTLVYQSFGPAPTEDINMVREMTVSEEGENITSHTVSGSGFLWHSSCWGLVTTGGRVAWYVKAPNEVPVRLNTLPSDYAKKHPFIKLPEIQSKVTSVLGGTRPFEDEIDELFKSGEQRFYQVWIKELQ
jgi:hypothetical protein